MSRLEAALNMARRGFRVFPLIEGGKKPAIDAFQIHATTDETIIRAWWLNRPNQNVGICTTGFVVVDIDTKDGRNGVTGYASLGGHYDTLCVRTASGGYHCYFKGPDSKLAVDIVSGVDIRSHHGYVVGPGSVTSSVHKDCVDGSYDIVNDMPVPDVPMLIGFMLAPPIVRQRTDNMELDKETSIANAVVWLQTAEPAISGMHGNDTTYRICARLVRDYALSEETAFQILLEHWNHRCVPPWAQAELLQLVNNAAAYGIGDSGRALPEMQMQGAVVLPVPPPPPPKTAQQIGVYMGNAVDPANLLPRPWKVMQILMNGDVTMLGGAGAAGKSMLEMVLAAHWALGKDFMHFKLRVPGAPLRTIMYNAEDDTMEQSRRLMAVCHAYGLDYLEARKNIAMMDDRSGELWLARMYQGSIITNDEALRFLRETAMDTRADVLMFDPLVNLHLLNENDAGQMRFVLSLLRGLSRMTNSATMAAQHTSKGSSQKEKGDADVFRGSGAIVNSARVGLVLSPITEHDAGEFGVKKEDRLNFARLDNAKQNYGQKTGKAMAYAEWTNVGLSTGDKIGVLTPANFENRAKDRNAHIAQVIHGVLMTNGRGAVLRSQVVKALHEAEGFFYQMPNSTIAKALERVLDTAPLKYGVDTITWIIKENNEKLIGFA